MSTPQHPKRTRDTTADTEANKRQKFSSEAEPQARKPIIDARRQRAQDTPNQATPGTADEPLDDDHADLLLTEQEEAERLDLEERQAIRRLNAIRARKAARQSRTTGGTARASVGVIDPPATPARGYRPPVTPSRAPGNSGGLVGSSLQPIDLDPAPGRSQEMVSVKQELYKDILSTSRVANSTAPTTSRPTAVPSSSRPVFRRPRSLPQDGAIPVAAPASAWTGPASVKSTTTGPTSTKRAAPKPAAPKLTSTKPTSHTVSTTSKRSLEEFTADTFDEYNYYDLGPSSQRRKLSNGRSSPVLPPFSSTPKSSEPQREARLPSSDGIDLKELHPKRPVADQPQKRAHPRATPSGCTAPRPVRGSETPAATTAVNARVVGDNNIRAPPKGSPVAPPASSICPEPADTYQRDPALARFFESAALDFQSPIFADVPLQSNLPLPFAPFATTEHLGKHGRGGDTPTVDEEAQDEAQRVADEPTTKRQKRIKRIEAKGEMLGKDNRKMNMEIRQTANGSLEVLVQGVWTSAAYHNDRRHALLERADREGTWGTSAALTINMKKKGLTQVDTEHGVDPEDRMAFHPKWKDVNIKERAKRPDILHQWKADPKPEKYHPGFLYDDTDGKLLIDQSGFPIKAWPDLPVCVSGQTSPIWFELWRRVNQNISVRDIWARCPKRTQRKPGQKVQELTLQAFSNRNPRDGSENIGAQLLKLMPNHVKADLDAVNSTGGWRNFTSAEVDAISSINHGIESAQGRAGNKALPEAVKKERDEKRRAKFEATLKALLEEKEEIDRKHQASLDEEAAEEAADTAFEGPVQEAEDQLPKLDAEHSDPDADMASYPHDPLVGHDNIFPQAELGSASVRTNDINGGSDDTIFLDPALEEGDTTLVEDVSSHQPITLEALEEKGKICLGLSGFEEPNWDEVDFNFLAEGQNDYRLKFPDTEDQIASILAALEKTREECRRLTGMNPPEVELPTSYFLHYHELQGWLNDIYYWTRPGVEVPTLFERPAWTECWDSWILQDEASPDVQTQDGASKPGEGMGDDLPTNVNLDSPAKGAPEHAQQYPDLDAGNKEGESLEQGWAEGDGLDDLFDDQDLTLDVGDPGVVGDGGESLNQAVVFGEYDPTLTDWLKDQLTGF
ncbi:MAG: hypothetical protein Q9208_002781 [Pyrenodesmia sp. 3 TL-2023]